MIRLLGEAIKQKIVCYKDTKQAPNHLSDFHSKKHNPYTCSKKHFEIHQKTKNGDSVDGNA